MADSGRVFDAVVIGAGPAGAAAALALARHGWAVAIVEKSTFPRRKVCGEYISATNLPLLDRLGAGGAWRAEAGPEIRRVGFFAADISTEAPMPPAAGGGFGRALGRDVLDLLLLDAAGAAGAEIFQPWRAAALADEGALKAVRIEAKDRHAVLRAPVVIAAHGSWEPGKLPTQLAKVNGPSDLLGFKAHFRGAAMPDDLMPMLLFPGGYGGMVWADRGRLSLSCCIRRDALQRARATFENASASEALHRHIMARNRGVREAIGGAGLDGPWLASGPIRPGIRAAYEDDIFRAGNVAGESQPIIAEGITMGMQSGWLLASELARIDPRDRGAREAAGKRYSAAFRTLFATRIYASRLFALIAVRPISSLAMRHVVRGLPAVLTIGARLSGKTRSVPGLGEGIGNRQ